MKRLVSIACLSLLLTSPASAQKTNGFDLSGALVPVKEIHWGGVRRDGIPSIDRPEFIAAEDAGFLSDSDRVLGVHRNGIAKAYAIRILDRHEIVNDKFGDETIVVTYCPLCFSGMAFALDPGTSARSFGVSGLLYNSDVLLYDRQTESLWSQLQSQAISGPLKGESLQPLVTTHTTWRKWRARYPDTLVLSRQTGFRINYRHSPYDEYQRSPRLMFPVAHRSKEYRNKDLVLGVTIGDASKAYAFKELRRQDEQSFEDRIGERDVVIEWHEKDKYARVLDVNGSEIPSVIVYWFAWYAFHPTTSVFQTASD